MKPFTLVTGGHGFVGRHLVGKLGPEFGTVYAPRATVADLRQQTASRIAMWGNSAHTPPNYVFHLAGRIGGIGETAQKPADFLYDNAIMGLHLFHELNLLQRASAIRPRAVIMGSVCGYPKNTPTPFIEEDFWNGYPEETNASYGMAKRLLVEASRAYRQQYGLDSVVALSTNLFGPGDSFDLGRAHVIGALIRRFIEATDLGQPVVVVWGTGSATRDFLYVEDAAEALIALARAEDVSGGPYNIGAGRETSIAEIAETIARLTGYSGQIVFDTSKPDGQPRRLLDISRVTALTGWRPRVGLEEGLGRTIEWYRLR